MDERKTNIVFICIILACLIFCGWTIQRSRTIANRESADNYFNAIRKQQSESINRNKAIQKGIAESEKINKQLIDESAESEKIINSTKDSIGRNESSIDRAIELLEENKRLLQKILKNNESRATQN